MVPTHLKNISQNGNLPQIGVKIKNVWNHHLVLLYIYSSSLWSPENLIQEACSSFWSTPIEEVSIAPQKIQEPISSPGPKNPQSFWIFGWHWKTPDLLKFSTFKTEKQVEGWFTLVLEVAFKQTVILIHCMASPQMPQIESFNVVFRWIRRVEETQRNTPVLLLGSGKWDPPSVPVKNPEQAPSEVPKSNDAVDSSEIPTRELTCPTWGKGKSSSKCHFWGIC